jgi:hypothetical protein
MTNPIERILMFPLDVTHDNSTRVEVIGSGGLSDVRISDFDNRAEALAYAERIGTHYGVEVTELTPDDEDEEVWDAEDIYGQNGIRQSIEEDRR